jgi:hypothetical protein
MDNEFREDFLSGCIEGLAVVPFKIIGWCWNVGTVLAVCISWSLHHSVEKGFAHGLLGWFYVVYYLFIR